MSDQDPPMDVQPTDAAAGAPADYQLSRIIAAHTNDIKCLTSTVSGAIISGSRDEKVKLLVARGGTFNESLCFNNRMAVNAVAFLVWTNGSSPPLRSFSLTFCGRKDGTVAVYKDAGPEPAYTLHAHSANVCVLQVSDEFRQLITGSWDHTSMVYDLNELIAGRNPELFRLFGHSNPIWAAAFIPQETNFFLTGSADRTIIQWDGPEAVRTYAGHSDAVRGLLTLNGDFFVSTANDSTLRVWDTKSGSSTDIASVQLPGDRTLVANCGEEGMIEIWELDAADRNLRPLQTIRTPATSLWAVRALSGGDLAVGASNGYIYVFSPHAHRVATADQRKVFEANVQAMADDRMEKMGKASGGSGKAEPMPLKNVLLEISKDIKEMKQRRRGSIVQFGRVKISTLKRAYAIKALLCFAVLLCFIVMFVFTIQGQIFYAFMMYFGLWVCHYLCFLV
ncbi:PFU domain-containing protein [Aphelenchoides fujianensis]|nr:PFU domain-containing protein [Aphelenchoides fujianensis]